MKHGFIKVAAAAPEIRVADPMFNADAVIRAMDEHARLGVKVLVFPELTLTGATCGDLFYQNTLLAGAAAALERSSRRPRAGHARVRRLAGRAGREGV